MDILMIMAVVASGSVFFLVIDLIRRGRLKERYSLLWLCASIILFVLSLSRHLLERLSGMLGIHYPPSFLFLVAFIFLLLITMHFSSVISVLSEKNKQLAQEVALLRQEMTQLRGKAGAPGNNRGATA